MRFFSATAIAAALVVAQPLLGSAVVSIADIDAAAYAKGKDKAKSKKPSKAKGPKVKPREMTAGASNSVAPGNSASAKNKPKNVNAQLKGLNSLKRNINGLMNSSDPKMDGFRAFVLAGADAQAAQEALDSTQSDYDALAASYDALLGDLGLALPTDVSDYDALLAGLQAISDSTAPDPLDYTDDTGVFDQADYDAAVAQWTTDVTNAQQAIADYDAMLQSATDLASAQDDFDAATDAVSEDALIQAIVDGLNATGAGPVGPDDVTQEMLDWVSQEMGVGEADGLMDDYLDGLEAADSPLNADDLDSESDQVSVDPDFIGSALPESGAEPLDES